MKRALLVGSAAVAVLALMGPAARAVDQDAVDAAIARGVAYLHKPEVRDQAFPESIQHVGAACLIGLTLLECGAGPDDDLVRRDADVARQASVSCHETYSLALAILFLDRLGDPADESLIQSMGVRLMAGQNGGGGWTYNCPDTPDFEVRRLTSLLEHRTELVGHREPPKDDKGQDGKPSRPTVKDLPKEIQDLIARFNVVSSPEASSGDNSNTQFAVLGVWAARRHGLPVDKALGRVNLRFRATQNADGGWSYVPTAGAVTTEPNMGGVMGTSSASMTCAGLLGLIVAHGAAAENALESGKPVPDISTDRVLKKGLATLATAVGKPAGKGETPPQIGGKSYYFLWSLERVGVLLDLDTIGGKDWYGWGAEALLANEGPDGSWHGEYPPPVDTCFALLFLKRANLAPDLTAGLKGKLTDPGGVLLHSGDLHDPLKGVEAKDQPKGPAETHPTTPPPVVDETEGGRMARELVQAPPERREGLLQEYRDGKGVTYTEALAGAIPQLAGDDKRQARDALADRLTRMKADTLSHYFTDQDAEIRRAAALAAAMKEAKTLIPDLIPLLDDPEPTVARAAHAALMDLTGEKIGPSVGEWQEWWKNRDR